MDAIEESDMDTMEMLIKQGADVNHSCRFGITPLLLAIMKGHVQCVNILLNYIVNIDEVCGLWSPLICAVHYNHIDILLTLLNANVAIDETDEIEGNNALMVAAKRGYFECVSILLQHGCSIDEQNKNGETALMMAAKNGHKYCLQLLLDFHANIDVQDEFGFTALMYSGGEGNVDCTKCLINGNANLEISDNWNNNALMKCLMEDISPDHMCALCLIRAGSPVNQVNYNGDTALSLAVLDDDSNVINELLANGVDVNQCVNNRTALWYAANNSFHNCVKILLDAEADPNVGEPPLVQAARYSTVDCVKIILEAGADINRVDQHFGTMMLMGAYVGKREIVEIGLNAGAEINTSTMAFYMPIVHNEEALMLLFAAGEDTSYFNYNEDAPASIVKTRRDFSLQNLSRRAIHNQCLLSRPKQDLFNLVELLPIPRLMKNYLLYNISI